MFNKETYPNKRFHPLKVLFFITVFIVLAAAASWLVMFLWNAILPETVGVKPLNFWKAAGLLLLAKILFGGFGRGRGPGHWRGKHRGGPPRKKKWTSMNQEERQEMKERWREHCRKRKSSDE